MPILTKKQKEDKVKENEKTLLINLIKKITVELNGERVLAVDIDLKEKSIGITHPVYDLLSHDQKLLLVKLIDNFSFYIQWKFFPISSL